MKDYNVAASIKIYVEDPSKIPQVKSSLESLVKIQQLTEEDVGFGIKVLRATVLLDDSEGGMDQLEEKIKNLESVSQVEVETVTRV